MQNLNYIIIILPKNQKQLFFFSKDFLVTPVRLTEKKCYKKSRKRLKILTSIIL